MKVIEKHINGILFVTSYLTMDGYLMKKEFINPLYKKGLHIITKGRRDANLMYLKANKKLAGEGRNCMMVK